MDKNICAEIGKRIKTARENQNETIDVLADNTHLSVSTIVRYERGEPQKIDNLLHIAEELGVSLDYLINGDDNDGKREYAHVKFDFGSQLVFTLNFLLANSFVKWNRVTNDISINQMHLPMIDFLEDMFYYARSCSRPCYDPEKKDYIDQYYIVMERIKSKYVKIFNDIDDSFGEKRPK